MSPSNEESLTRREREIMDILYEKDAASASEVMAAMEDAPSYSAVRGLLRVLLEKEHVRFRKEGSKNVYRPRKQKRVAGKNALKRALETFYGGNTGEAVAALLDVSGDAMTPEDRDRLMRLIEDARSEEA